MTARWRPGRHDHVIKISALAGRIEAVARLEGDFLLRSGVRSKEYFDKYRFEADPTLLREIAHGLAPMVPGRLRGARRTRARRCAARDGAVA